MKNLFKLLSFFFVAGILFSACKKDEHKDYFLGGKSPILSASTDVAALSYYAQDQEAIKLSWTDPDYKFTTGLSSQDISYTLEIDEAGNNFGGAHKYSTTFTKDLSVSYTSEAFNAILLSMKLSVGDEHDLEARIISSLTNTSLLGSNIVSFAATPYTIPPKVVFPETGELWMVGDASPAGWDNPMKTPYDVSQKFKLSDPTDLSTYELTVTLPGKGGYKLIQKQGDWDTQYHQVSGTWEGGTFEKKNSDPQFPGPPDAGQYKITIDFQAGTYKVVKL